MEGRRCGDIVWGRKESLVLQRGGSPDYGERRERQRETQNSAEGTLPPKSLTGKMRGVDYHEFLQPPEFKDWSFRILCHGRCGLDYMI